MTSLLLLTGCVKVSFTGPEKEKKTSQSTSTKKEPLTFVRADQYKDQDKRSLGSIWEIYQGTSNAWRTWKIICLFPRLYLWKWGKSLRLVLYRESYHNNIDRDGSFVLNLEYDGEPLFKDVTVDYEVSESGVLKPNRLQPFLSKSPRNKKKKWRAWTIRLKQKWASMTLNLRISRWRSRTDKRS